jgi:hypothetical protein
MRDFANGNPFYNAGGDLRGRFGGAGGVNRYYQEQLRAARQAGDQAAMDQARAGRADFKDFRMQNPSMFGGATFSVQPEPEPPVDHRVFANGNPFYNAAGELRNRYAQAGGVNQFFQNRIGDARQAGDMASMERFQQGRQNFKDWRSQQGAMPGGDQSFDGGPMQNPDQVPFANGNPFYNRKGNLRMPWRDGFGAVGMDPAMSMDRHGNYDMDALRRRNDQMAWDISNYGAPQARGF